MNKLHLLLYCNFMQQYAPISLLQFSNTVFCTVYFQVLAAEIHYPWHLSVNRVKAELFVVVLLPAAGRLIWQRQLEGLQEPRLVIIKVSDAIHRHTTLSSRWVTAVYTVNGVSNKKRPLLSGYTKMSSSVQV